MFAQLFSGDVLGRARADPRTAAYASQPDFQRMVAEVKANPSAFGKYLQDQRMLQLLGVLSGVPASAGEYSSQARVSGIVVAFRGPHIALCCGLAYFL